MFRNIYEEVCKQTMKVIILAGGSRSTISDAGESLPKPMVEIGEKPLLWHIMKQFSYFGFTDFLICGGYKVNLIKDYFMDYYIYQSDVTIDLSNNQVTVHNKKTENWNVTVMDTGLYSTTGLRVSQTEGYINDDMFLVTYGDCISNINVASLVSYAQQNDRIATLAVAKPTGRNSVLQIDEDHILENTYAVGQQSHNSWANACTYVFHKKVFHYLNGNYELDKQLLPELMGRKEIVAYQHNGFWRPVETLRDKVELESLWNAGIAPWKVWSE